MQYRFQFMALLILAISNVSGIAMARSVHLTVYNDNRALVSDQRSIKLSKGINEIRFTDVAALIDPTSVSFTSHTDPKGTSVLEQNFEYDLVSTGKLLQKYIDQYIHVVTDDGTKYEGTLLGNAGGLIIQTKDGAITVLSEKQVREIQFTSLPEGLITKPTLMWIVKAGKSGSQNIEVAYLTSGIGWHADYVLSLSPDNTQANLDGWVTVDNRAGMTFSKTTLKLVAGELHKVKRPRRRNLMYKTMAREPAAPEVQERPLFEYHLYEVQRPVNVKNNQTKQIEFIEAKDIPMEKRFVLDSGVSFRYFGPDRQKGKVQVQIRFRNGKDQGLGVPLPAGKIRLYQQDVDGSRQLIGEDRIDHTPKDEHIVLVAGNAFDIVGERKKVAEKVLGKRARQETWEIKVRNHKDKPVTVHIIEHLSHWGEWEIVRETTGHTKLDASSVEYIADIRANGAATVRYTVIYRW